VSFPHSARNRILLTTLLQINVSDISDVVQANTSLAARLDLCNRTVQNESSKLDGVGFSRGFTASRIIGGEGAQNGQNKKGEILADLAFLVGA